jgi:hypothetical protein
MPSGPAQGPGGRRRGPPHSQHAQHYSHGGGHPSHQFHQQTMPYQAYNMQNMQTYNQFYGHPHMHPPYQAGAMGSPGYAMYPTAPFAARSPPMQQYVPMVGVTVQQNFSPRQSQGSPALATPYLPPAAPTVPPVTAAAPQQPPPPTESPLDPTPVSSPPLLPTQASEPAAQPASTPASPETQTETQTETPPAAVHTPYRLTVCSARLSYDGMPNRP